MKSAVRKMVGGLSQIDDKYGMDTAGSVRKLADGKLVRDDEPLIVFRAQDSLSVPLLEEYARMCRRAGAQPSLLAVLYDRIAQFARWQAENPGLVKVPDSELREIIR